jgi:hypothetical protein
MFRSLVGKLELGRRRLRRSIGQQSGAGANSHKYMHNCMHFWNHTASTRASGAFAILQHSLLNSSSLRRLTMGEGQVRDEPLEVRMQLFTRG